MKHRVICLDITLHRYESGALQDEAHNNELLLMKDPDNFRLLFERGQDKLAPHLIRQIEKRLVGLSSEKHQNWFKKSFISVLPDQMQPLHGDPI
ncbi:hypothetical protein HKBW3S06_00679, partial [Candidatus Hakubella thermalkaliphila]